MPEGCLRYNMQVPTNWKRPIKSSRCTSNLSIFHSSKKSQNYESGQKPTDLRSGSHSKFLLNMEIVKGLKLDTIKKTAFNLTSYILHSVVKHSNSSSLFKFQPRPSNLYLRTYNILDCVDEHFSTSLPHCFTKHTSPSLTLSTSSIFKGVSVQLILWWRFWMVGTCFMFEV